MTSIPADRSPSHGGRVYRIRWVPGTDWLRAECHCNAERQFDDPIELWEWLLDHPHGRATDDWAPAPTPAGALVMASA
jgi:hypothetical protein